MDNKKKSDRQKKAEAHREVNKYSGIAIKMALIITAGALGGNKLDEYFELEQPIITIILSLAAVALAMYVVIIELNRK